MKEIILEQLERSFPNGFLVACLDKDRCPRLTGNAIDGHPFLTAVYHQALATAAITSWDLPLPPPGKFGSETYDPT